MKPIALIRIVIIILILLSTFFVFSGTGSGKKIKKSAADTSVCLEISGKISKAATKTSGGYTVTLVHHNTPVDSLVVKEGSSFKFLLKENAWYAVQIKKEGYTQKMISINTSLPEDKYNKLIFKLSFVIDELISQWESKHLDSDALDFPIAIFAFDKKKEAFYYSEEYTSNIKKSLLEPLTTPVK
jgi:hypothetical protein